MTPFFIAGFVTYMLTGDLGWALMTALLAWVVMD
jgi:hypothetical protein